MILIALSVLVGALAYFIGIPRIKRAMMERKLANWNDTPKDLVIMHCPPRARTLPHASPFVMKLETFMRMAKITYKADLGLKNAWGPKGKFPWISINGQHIADTQFIIKFLTKKFDVNLNGKYSKEELAVGEMVRITMDEHLFWAIPFYRFVYSSYKSLQSIMPKRAGTLRPLIFQTFAKFTILRRSKGHGIGLHSKPEMEELFMNDLQHLSDLLGDRKFILGDEPCEYDAAVFGQLSQFMWGLPDTVFATALSERKYPNLTDYCLRMKTTFWPDWDQVLHK